MAATDYFDSKREERGMNSLATHMQTGIIASVAADTALLPPAFALMYALAH
jgi:hypothetical protein